MRTHVNRASRVLLGIVVATLLLVACGDDDSSEETWVEIEGVVAQMQAASPPELEADVATAAGYYPTASDELEAANWDVSVLDSLEPGPDHAAAEENITAYLDANC